MRITQLVILVVCLSIVGCGRPTIYRVSMTPEGEGVRRELTVVNGDELEPMLRKIYANVPVDEWDEPRYKGVFHLLPEDVGGSGTWLKISSPMGQVYGYAERFRGDDDLVGQVEARLLATDRMADLLIAWFELELEDDPAWATLRAFMDTQMRHDMKNMSLYLLELERAGQTEEQWFSAYVARVGQYLIDRGYLEAGDLGAMLRMFSPSSDGPDDLLERMVAVRMGLADGEEVPASLGFLKWKEGEITDSWEGFIDSPACAEIVNGWGELEADEQIEPGDIEGTVVFVFLSAIGTEFELFRSPDEVHMKLSCPVEPIVTNGEWYAEAGEVYWDGHIRERFGLPLFYYAFWGEADEVYQTGHFGEVLFDGERMAQMVLWYTGLSAEDQQRWDVFVESLDPSSLLEDQVDAARDVWDGDEDDPLSWGYTQIFNTVVVE